MHMEILLCYAPQNPSDWVVSLIKNKTTHPKYLLYDDYQLLCGKARGICMNIDKITKHPISIATFKALPIIFIVIGLLLIFIGNKTLVTIGGALLSGGAFASILKSLQFTGIFKAELSKIIVDHEYLKDLSDKARINLWEKMTASIHENTFPRISDEIHTEIRKNFLPTDKKHYYENYQRTCNVSWHDEIQRIIESEETISYTIVPKSKDEKIDLEYTYEATITNGLFETEIEILKLEIDKDDRSDCVVESHTNTGDLKKINYSYKIELQGKDSYSFERVIKKKFSLSADPYARYYSDTFIKNSQINVEIEVPGLCAIFIEAGSSKAFKDIIKNKPNNCARKGVDILKKQEGLLFPKQGYVLHYHCE